MKKKILFFAFLLIIGLSSIVYGMNLPKVFIMEKEIPNSGDFFVKDNTVYVNEEALRWNLGIDVFYDKNENRIRLYPTDKMQLEARCEMFEEFATLFTPASPDEVANLWAEGVKTRNGVLQYVVFNKSLKDEFFKSVGQSWVTGASSPWVESYKINKEKIAPNLWKYTITFTATTSAKDKYIWNAVLTVGKENDKWRIVKLEKDF